MTTKENEGIRGRRWKPGPPQKGPGPIQAFFLSYTGRSCVRGAGLALIVGTFTGYVTINTWLMDKYRDIIQHYEHGFPLKMKAKLQTDCDQVMEDMGIKERYRKAVRLFYMYGFDPFSIGSLKTKYGILLGVPKYFNYEKPSDVEKNEIQIEMKPVAWESEDGQLFQNALVLSDNAKKFAIAQELFMGDSNYVYINASLHSAPILLYTLASAQANQMFYGLHKPLSFRLIFVYGFVGIFSYGVWAVSRDLYTKYLENYGDEQAAKLGVDYAKGGVEYYSKLIQRNIAQRALMGPRGEKVYTPLGNYKELIRQKHVPLTDRKINAEKQVKAFLGLEASKDKENFSEEGNNISEDSEDNNNR